jgi:enoyl-CoA hydratase/carnithine racemase
VENSFAKKYKGLSLTKAYICAAACSQAGHRIARADFLTNLDSETMATNTALRITKITPAYWRATLHSPPLNLFSPEVYAGLRLLLDDLENDKEVRVVVFDSDVPGYFCAHYDLLWPTGDAEPVDMPGYAPVLGDWPNFVHRLSNLGVVSIASIRGRVRGHGSEFVLACDMRFASREKAILSQPEVGAGVAPGGGGLEWLPRLCGRSRALEILLGSDDFDGATAELYGYVNRALPDAELNEFVDNFARRIAGFDKFPLVHVKRFVNQRTGTTNLNDIHEAQALFLRCSATPETQRRVKDLFSAGLQQPGETEDHLGRALAQVASD